MRFSLLVVTLICALAFLSGVIVGPPVTGFVLAGTKIFPVCWWQPQVINGDTFSCLWRKFDLDDFDAPETNRAACERALGEVAKQKLQSILDDATKRGQSIRVAVISRHRSFQKYTARLTIDGNSVGEKMLEAGMGCRPGTAQDWCATAPAKRCTVG